MTRKWGWGKNIHVKTLNQIIYLECEINIIQFHVFNNKSKISIKLKQANPIKLIIYSCSTKIIISDKITHTLCTN